MQPRNNNNNNNRMMRNNNNKHRHGRNNNNGQNRNAGGGGNNGANRPRINISHATNQRDKFQNQARDAMHNGDRVLSEYYLQHADHYQRLINEYNEEQESRRQQMPETPQNNPSSEEAQPRHHQHDGYDNSDSNTAQTENVSVAAEPKSETVEHKAPRSRAKPKDMVDIIPAAILPPAIPLDTDDLAPITEE